MRAVTLCSRRLPALSLAGICAVLAGAVYAFAFDTARGRGWDGEIVHAATGGRNIPAVQEASAGLIDTISIGSLVLLGGGIVVAALLIGRPRAALGAALLIAGANGTTQVLKPLITADHRFPSGHATVAMSLALAAVLVAPPAWNLLAGLAGAAYAAGVGVSLVIQAAHYPSDVAAGYLVAGAWAGAIAALVPGDADRPRRSRAGLVAAGIAVAAFAVAVAVAAVEHPGIVVRVEDRTKLVFALVVLGGVALVVALAFAALQAMALRSASTTRA